MMLNGPIEFLIGPRARVELFIGRIQEVSKATFGTFEFTDISMKYIETY